MPSTCRSCGQPILWTRVQPNGKAHPVDPGPVSVDRLRDAYGLLVLADDPTVQAVVVTHDQPIGAMPAGTLYRSHFATCPNASMHRRRRKRSEHTQPQLGAVA